MKKILPVLTIAIALSFGLDTSHAQLNNPRNVPYQWDTDTSMKTVDLAEIDMILPRNSFPTLDYPKFVGKKEGLKSFFIHEPVLAVTFNGESKAYPLNMLTMHEISNDSCGGIPILVTFCPLCNSSVVYDRRLTHNGKDYLLDFEVSGMLRWSDMVMADKETQTWWQQLMGDGMVGELAGAQLTELTSMLLSVEEYFESYPDGKILDHHTGSTAEPEYGTNPYVHYDSAGHKPYERFYDLDHLDTSLPAMERIIAVKSYTGFKIYPYTIIEKSGTINDEFDGRNIAIFFEEGMVSILDEKDISKSRVIGTATVFSGKIDGRLLTFQRGGKFFVDNETKSMWDITGHCLEGEMKGKELTPMVHSNHFAFAWLTFNPDSEIYSE